MKTVTMQLDNLCTTTTKLAFPLNSWSD